MVPPGHMERTGLEQPHILGRVEAVSEELWALLLVI